MKLKTRTNQPVYDAETGSEDIPTGIVNKLYRHDIEGEYNGKYISIMWTDRNPNIEENLLEQIYAGKDISYIYEYGSYDDAGTIHSGSAWRDENSELCIGGYADYVSVGTTPSFYVLNLEVDGEITIEHSSTSVYVG